MKQYIEALKDCYQNGIDVDSRAGKVRKSFGYQMRFNLQDGFPAVTTKKLAWKAVVSELIWFLEGSNDERRLAEILYADKRENLSDKKTIWTQNAKADYWKNKANFDGDVGKIYGVHYTIFVLILFTIIMTITLNRTTFGRNVFAVGGNEEAAKLSGIRVNLITIYTFAMTGFAAGIAGAIQVSRISLGQPQAGLGMELQAIAAVILGGTSIYGGSGAVWRSVAGVMLLALINNGFNILNADPFYKDLIFEQ